MDKIMQSMPVPSDDKAILKFIICSFTQNSF